ncbi:hypothetical protein EJB05_45820, partial [Eragrostis curvula]
MALRGEGGARASPRAAAVQRGSRGQMLAASAVTEEDSAAAAELTVVMKFGGSVMASAEQIEAVASIVRSYPEAPVVVLSAMGKTTNNLLLAGEKAVSCGIQKASEIPELLGVKDLHLRTIDELELDRSILSGVLDELELFFKGIASKKKLNRRTRDRLVSFGGRMSTTIFAALLNKHGRKARQYDAPDIVTTDEFTYVDILEPTYPAMAKRLQGDWIDDCAIPIVTGSLGKGWKSFCVTTLGRGGSDLTATAIGKALGVREIQIWKDVNGVLTCDPNIYANALPVSYLTFTEAAELAYFGAQVLHPRSMQPAWEGGIPVRLKNLHNHHAPGTVITKERDASQNIFASIVLKSNVTILDIVSTQMVGQYDFLQKVSSIFEDLDISVDRVPISEVSISLILDPSQLGRPELIQQELRHVVEELEKIAIVELREQRSIISLIGSVHGSSSVLEKASHVLQQNGVNGQMISLGPFQGNISLVVLDSEAQQCVQALHSAFFENGFLSEVEGAAAVHGPNAAAAAFGDDNSGNPNRPIQAANVSDEDQERNRLRRDGWGHLKVSVVLVIVLRTIMVVLWWLLLKKIKEEGVLAWLKPGVWLISTTIYWLLKKHLTRRYRVKPKEDCYFLVHAIAYCIFKGLVDTKIGSQGPLIPLIVAHIVSFFVDLLGVLFIAMFCDVVGDIEGGDMY